jgi:hypothetical protein
MAASAMERLQALQAMGSACWAHEDRHHCFLLTVACVFHSLRHLHCSYDTFLSARLFESGIILISDLDVYTMYLHTSKTGQKKCVDTIKLGQIYEKRVETFKME